MNSKIIIAKPCHENWNKMTMEEQGRHCLVCSKVVKDFTKMKTEDIVQTLKTTEGEICGRIGVKELTPANNKQKISFWMNGFLYRKAIYPVMALLGIAFITKKATAQTGDYPVKGKMDYRDYHTNDKKLNMVIKTNQNSPLANAHIKIVSGLVKEQKDMTTDANGRITFNFEASNLLSNVVEVEIIALGYETRTSKITLIKDIQTVEIKMEEEMMIMGEMMFVPDEKIDEPKSIKVDSVPKIEICKCDFKEIKDLKLVEWNVVEIDDRIIDRPNDIDTNSTVEKIDETISNTSEFVLFPNPSTDFVTIQYNGKENFNVDIFDASGKKIHAIVNVNERYQLDLTKYAAGTYYALITIEGRAVETKKIIVSR